MGPGWRPFYLHGHPLPFFFPPQRTFLFPRVGGETPHPRRGRRLGPNGGASPRTSARGGPASPCASAGASQGPPSRVEHTAFWAAVLNKPHQRRLQPAAAAARREGGARHARRRRRRRTRWSASGLQRPPTSMPRTRRRWGPAAQTSG